MEPLKTGSRRVFWRKMVNIKRNISEDDHMVHLVEDLCNSVDCETNYKDAVDYSYPADTERSDKTFDVGVGLESFSGEAAGYVQSSGSSIYLKTVLFFITPLCYCLL